LNVFWGGKQKSPPVYGVGIIKKYEWAGKQKSPPVYGVGIIKKYEWAGKQKSPPVYGVGIKIIRGCFCEFYIL
jgi:hypothetical protein